MGAYDYDEDPVEVTVFVDVHLATGNRIRLAEFEQRYATLGDAHDDEAQRTGEDEGSLVERQLEEAASRILEMLSEQKERMADYENQQHRVLGQAEQ